MGCTAWYVLGARAASTREALQWGIYEPCVLCTAMQLLNSGYLDIVKALLSCSDGCEARRLDDWRKSPVDRFVLQSTRHIVLIGILLCITIP